MKHILACIVSALSVATVATTAAGSTAPNIIVIVSDDAGYADFSMQGSETFLTPHIDSIAANGVRFTNAYVTAPVCSPSRAGMLTGRYQVRFGHEINIQAEDSPEQGLPVGEKTMADVMKEAGYSTMAIGKWHLGCAPEFHPTARGFQSFYGFIGGNRPYLPKPDVDDTKRLRAANGSVPETFGYLTDELAKRAAAFIREKKGEPFFLYLAFNAVHQPYQATPEDLAKVHGLENSRKAVCAMTLALDRGVGFVLDELKEHSLTENTLIFFINDNGGAKGGASDAVPPTNNSPLRGYKGSAFEGGIRVPFAMQWPSRIPKGMVCDHPVISLDIMATAIAAANALRPRNIEGVDLMPHLAPTGGHSRPSQPPHEALFWRFGSVRAVRKGDWKYVTDYKQPEMLFNLATDLSEQNNLAAQEPAKLKELKEAYNQWNSANVPPKWFYPKKDE